jgi:hypothetical protein
MRGPLHVIFGHAKIEPMDPHEMEPAQPATLVFRDGLPDIPKVNQRKVEMMNEEVTAYILRKPFIFKQIRRLMTTCTISPQNMDLLGVYEARPYDYRDAKDSHITTTSGACVKFM